MNIKSFKINDLNTQTKVLLTKSEAIGLCKRGNHAARKVFLRQFVEKLLEIEEIKTAVAGNSIVDPLIRKLNDE